MGERLDRRKRVTKRKRLNCSWFRCWYVQFQCMEVHPAAYIVYSSFFYTEPSKGPYLDPVFCFRTGPIMYLRQALNSIVLPLFPNSLDYRHAYHDCFALFCLYSRLASDSRAGPIQVIKGVRAAPPQQGLDLIFQCVSLLFGVQALISNQRLKYRSL